MKTAEKTGEVNGIVLDVLGKTIEDIRQDPEFGKAVFRVHNRWIAGNHNCSTVNDYYSVGQERKHKRSFELHADEPEIVSGADEAANPVEHLLHSLASCVTTAMVDHAAVRGLHIQELRCEVDGDVDVRGFLGLADVPKGVTSIRIRFKAKAPGVDLEQLKQLAEFSPVYNTLVKCVNIEMTVEPLT